MFETMNEKPRPLKLTLSGSLTAKADHKSGNKEKKEG